MNHSFSLMGDGVGMVGVFLLILAYFLLQTDRLKAHDLAYLWLNLTGSASILFSLTFSWNLSSALIQLIWIVISLYGLYKHFKQGPKQS